MTVPEQRQVAETAKELWTLMLPDVNAPELYTFLLWATFESEILTRAINRTAAKFRRMQRHPDSDERRRLRSILFFGLSKHGRKRELQNDLGKIAPDGA